MTLIDQIKTTTTPLVMGILNITPDSFFDGGNYNTIDAALKQTEKLIADGADLIDIGGESTRPGSDSVSVEEELDRVIPVMKAIKKSFPEIPLSIDTTKSVVMAEAVKAGVDLINDISGLLFDPRSEQVVLESALPVVMMHAPWRPKTMQQEFRYDLPIIDELIHYFKKRIDHLTKVGISKDQIIIDPGVGFGKSVEQNYTIITHLHQLKELGQPVLLGASNKSYLKTEKNYPPEFRKEGNALTEFIAMQQGVDFLRVHDVAATRRTLSIASRLQKSVK